jgi:hypothetical protein
MTIMDRLRAWWRERRMGVRRALHQRRGPTRWDPPRKDRRLGVDRRTPPTGRTP